MSASTPPSSPSPPSTFAAALDVLAAEIRAACAPPERISVPAWADRYRFLPKETSRKYGPWETSHVEIARGPMLAVTEPGVRIISVMSCTQLMKTDFLLNVFGYFVHTRPTPILMVQPKDESAESFSKERVTPMIRATPVLRERIGTGKTRKSDETIGYKTFPGGFVGVVGAGSPDNLARRPIGLALADEVDKYPVTREGDPFSLIAERLATYGAESLFVRACSPTVENESRIADSFDESDQRRASVACPSCGHRQFLDFFAHVDWLKVRDERGEVTAHEWKTARVHCESCGDAWTEGARLVALQSIRWHQTRPFDCCARRQVPLDEYAKAWRLLEAPAQLLAPGAGVEGGEGGEGGEGREVVPLDPQAAVARVWDWWEDVEEGRYALYRARCSECGRHAVDTRHAGFHASKLYSPHELDRPAMIADKWLKAKGHPERELAWWNTQMGLPHRPSAGRRIAADTLLARREVWEAEVPDGVVLITVGADTQDYRVELEVVGWGRDEESWSIDYVVIEGEMSDPQTQARVDAFLKKTWCKRDGTTLPVLAACMDSGGHHTQSVYAFSKERIGRRIWAIRGASERDGARNPVWPTKRPNKRNKATFRPVVIGGNTARDMVRGRVTMEATPAPGQALAGYMHFPADRDVGYFEQLLADRLVVKPNGVRTVRLWETPAGKANEAADCRVYAYAALCGLVHFGLQLNKMAARVAANAATSVAAGPPPEAAPASPTLGQALPPPAPAPALRPPKRSLASRLA